MRTLALSIIPLTLILTGCDELEGFGEFNRYKQDFQYSYALKSGGRLEVETRNGGVEISGWEKDTIEIVGTKYASTQQLLDNTRIDIVNSPDAVRIRTVTPSTFHGNVGAKFIIHVPVKVQLDRIATSNGGVHIEGIEGPARIRTSNGSVRVARLNGVMEIQTSNGSIETHECQGAVTLQTSNGSINADDVRGAFNATTSNGKITARVVDPEPRQTIHADSSNGSVDLSLASLKDNPVRISTSNSSITLHLPAAINAALNATTSNGSVQSDFEILTQPGRITKHAMVGNLGSGGPEIHLTTSNGGIRVLKN